MTALVLQAVRLFTWLDQQCEKLQLWYSAAARLFYKSLCKQPSAGPSVTAREDGRRKGEGGGVGWKRGAGRRGGGRGRGVVGNCE